MITSEKDLLNSMKVVGSKYADLTRELSSIDEHTHTLDIRGKEITLLSIANLEKYKEPDKTMVYVLGDEYIRGYIEKGEMLHLAPVENKIIGESLVEEARRTTGLLAVIDGNFYTVSQSAVATLTLRAGVKGENTVSRGNIIRDLHLADGTFINNEKICAVYREALAEDGTIVRKIFSFLGKQYQPVAQITLARVIDKVDEEKILGEPKVRQFEINHEFTDIYLDFPEAAEDFKATYKLKDEIVPGLFLCTSDTGSSSVIVRGTYRIGRSYITLSEVARKHTGSNKAEEIIEDVDEQIFTEFRKLPEALSFLLGKEVIDYASTDLSSPSGAEKNFCAVAELIKKLSKKLYNTKILAAKTRKELESELTDEINSSIHYTLYDLALLFMGIPERLEGLSRPVLDEIKKASAKAPYVLQEISKKARTDEEEERPVLLSA